MSQEPSLLLRLDAPYMSFGGVRVDHHNITTNYPSRSMLVGLVANALGLDRSQVGALSRLQNRLQFAARQDLPGQMVVDYQTVDLGQDFLKGGWTTRGVIERRDGGEASKTTHIRYRSYLADALYTVAVRLDDPQETPTLDHIADAIQQPERPLHIGRLANIPSSPIFLGRTEAPSLREALRRTPRAVRRHEKGLVQMLCWWPYHEDKEQQCRLVPVFETRDWENGIHTGQSLLREGMLTLSEGEVPRG